jgi:hypothetical protein
MKLRILATIALYAILCLATSAIAFGAAPSAIANNPTHFKSNLDQAKLVGADWAGTDVTDTNLRRANLVEAKLLGGNLNQSDTSNAKFSLSTLLKDNLQVLQLLVTVISTIIATLFIIPQFTQELAKQECSSATQYGAD